MLSSQYSQVKLQVLKRVNICQDSFGCEAEIKFSKIMQIVERVDILLPVCSETIRDNQLLLFICDKSLKYIFLCVAAVPSTAYSTHISATSKIQPTPTNIFPARVFAPQIQSTLTSDLLPPSPQSSHVLSTQTRIFSSST